MVRPTQVVQVNNSTSGKDSTKTEKKTSDCDSDRAFDFLYSCMTQTQNKLIRKGLIEKCGDARAHVVQSAHRLESIPHNISRIPQHSTACSMKPAACCHPLDFIIIIIIFFLLTINSPIFDTRLYVESVNLTLSNKEGVRVLGGT